MLRLTEIAGSSAMSEQGAATSPTPTPTPSLTLTLTFEDRRRSRSLVRLGDGRQAALMLPRGTVLREGDVLRDDATSPMVVVRAASETLSVARTPDPHLLTRAAYHLGNRHVPLQIGPGWLAFGHDHVLDGLVRELGLDVTTESAPFEPEAGGYRHQGSEHAHARAHDHAHDHNHDDDPQR
jgi:urease accessory protein